MQFMGNRDRKTFWLAMAASELAKQLGHGKKTMAKSEYEVCVPFTGIIWVTVEAENEADAINAAFESDQLKLDNVEEWEAHKEICSGNVLHASHNEAYAVKVK